MKQNEAPNAPLLGQTNPHHAKEKKKKQHNTTNTIARPPHPFPCPTSRCPHATLHAHTRPTTTIFSHTSTNTLPHISATKATFCSPFLFRSSPTKKEKEKRTPPANGPSICRDLGGCDGPLHTHTPTHPHTPTPTQPSLPPQTHQEVIPVQSHPSPEKKRQRKGCTHACPGRLGVELLATPV